MSKILGIETSCDDCALAIYDSKSNKMTTETFANLKMQQQFGGVVPELAARDHVAQIDHVFSALINKADISVKDITAIAYTRGPGLMGSLLVGAHFAQGLQLALNCPIIPIHHIAAHLHITQWACPNLSYPYIGLLVSGGHTEIILVRGLRQYQKIAGTLDDACGEAFDKSARIMGLSQPGGPSIELYAARFNPCVHQTIKLPMPMSKLNTLDISFSGLKSAMARSYEKSIQDESAKIAHAYALQKAVVDSLVLRLKRVIEKYPYPVVLAGGVAANQYLRMQASQVLSAGNGVYYPDARFCTDNGAMVAYTGWLCYEGAYDDAVDGFRLPDPEVLARTRLEDAW